MSKEKTINSMKYIMQHSPNNERWNNIWIDEHISKEEFYEVHESLTEAGFSVECTRGNEDIPFNVNIIIDNALEQGLQNPIWGEVLTKIKTDRENHIEAPRTIRSVTTEPIEDKVPKIKNRPISEWFTEDPEPTLDGKRAIMERAADEKRQRNKEARKILQQEFQLRKDKEAALKAQKMGEAIKQLDNLKSILPKTSDIENSDSNSRMNKRSHKEVARSKSR